MFQPIAQQVSSVLDLKFVTLGSHLASSSQSNCHLFKQIHLVNLTILDES